MVPFVAGSVANDVQVSDLAFSHSDPDQMAFVRNWESSGAFAGYESEGFVTMDRGLTWTRFDYRLSGNGLRVTYRELRILQEANNVLIALRSHFRAPADISLAWDVTRDLGQTWEREVIAANMNIDWDISRLQPTRRYRSIAFDLFNSPTFERAIERSDGTGSWQAVGNVGLHSAVCSGQIDPDLVIRLTYNQVIAHPSPQSLDVSRDGGLTWQVAIAPSLAIPLNGTATQLQMSLDDTARSTPLAPLDCSASRSPCPLG